MIEVDFSDFFCCVMHLKVSISTLWQNPGFERFEIVPILRHCATENTDTKQHVLKKKQCYRGLINPI
jgi:hypothetical protein